MRKKILESCNYTTIILYKDNDMTISLYDDCIKISNYARKKTYRFRPILDLVILPFSSFHYWRNAYKVLVQYNINPEDFERQAIENIAKAVKK